MFKVTFPSFLESKKNVQFSLQVHDLKRVQVKSRGKRRERDERWRVHCGGCFVVPSVCPDPLCMDRLSLSLSLSTIYLVIAVLFGL